MRLVTFIGSSVLLLLTACHNSSSKEEKEYFENGNLKEIRQYDNGKLNGEFKVFYLNGKLCTKAKFRNDIQIDTTFHYLEDGHIDAIAIYDKKGEKMKEIAFFPNGKIHVMRSYFVGSDEIIASKAYFENGMLNEYESDFMELEIYGRDKDSVRAKLHNCSFNDSVRVNIIKSFNYEYDFDAHVIRTVKFSKTKTLEFKLLKSDYLKNKVNIQIVAEKWEASKIKKVNSYVVQISKGTSPKHNVEGIYKIY